MSNLIKTELYKLRTSKLFVVLLLCMMAVNIITLVGSVMMMNTLADVPDAMKMDFSSMFSSPFTLDMMTMFMYISAVSFLFLDFNNGYIKNLAGQVSNRGDIVTSKFIVIAVHNLIFFLAAAVSNLIGGLIVGMNMDIQNLGAGIATFFIKWLLSLGIGAVLLFFAVGLKSKSFALIIGVMVSLSAFSLIYMGIDTAINNVLKLNGFSLSQYMPDALISSVNVAKGNLVANGIIAAIVFIVLFCFLAHVTFKKRDIK